MLLSIRSNGCLVLVRFHYAAPTRELFLRSGLGFCSQTPVTCAPYFITVRLDSEEIEYFHSFFNFMMNPW